MSTKRNGGYGKGVGYAVRQVLIDKYGHENYGTRAGYATKFMTFWAYLKRQGAKHLGEVTPAAYASAATAFAEDMKARNSIKYGHNVLCAANQVLGMIDRSLWLSPTKYLGRRQHIRTVPPTGLETEQTRACVDELISKGLLRPVAVVCLARETGMRIREATLANTGLLLKQASEHGSFNVQDGTKGGRDAPRWQSVTPDKLAALNLAYELRPKGSRNLLAPGEMYVEFTRRDIKRARKVLKHHGIKNFHDFRAAYACQRYKELTGRRAPVIDGRNPDREQDLAARLQISHELGHNRESVVGAYVGGRR